VTPAPFRFGVGPGSLGTGPEQTTPTGWRSLVRHIEDLGYSALNVGDHFDGRLAPLPALMAAAEATTSLRLGCFMLCNDYRRPAVLALEFATVDQLSGGRLEPGLGAGWMEADYARAGLAFDAARVRVDRLEAAVGLVKTELSAHLAVFSPTPSARLDGRDRPPFVMGGGGRRVLQMAAREADIVAFNATLSTPAVAVRPGASISADAVAERVEWVRAAAGARYAEIESQVFVHAVRVDADRDEAAAQTGARIGLSPDEVLRSPHLLVGSVDQIVDDLVARREQYGFSYIGIPTGALDALAPVVARLAGT
jgi:probable F420-dependent oxidoreductase